MSVLDYLRFYWPILMATICLCVYYATITKRVEFLALATLALFGASRLMSSDVIPLPVGWLDPDLTTLYRMVNQMHYVGQVVAAICGAFAVHRLAQTYSGTTRTWNRKAKRWETPS